MQAIRSGDQQLHDQAEGLRSSRGRWKLMLSWAVAAPSAQRAHDTGELSHFELLVFEQLAQSGALVQRQ